MAKRVQNSLASKSADWHELFANVLPTSADGVIVVLGNACNQTYTFQINGEQVLFLGEGDLHDVHFHRHEEEANLVDLLLTRPTSSKLKSDAPLNQDYCGYKIRVYPSRQMYDEYILRCDLYSSGGSVLSLLSWFYNVRLPGNDARKDAAVQSAGAIQHGRVYNTKHRRRR
jgi:hypothetical protein